MLTPFNGFKKFGYDLAENQSVFFMIHRFPDKIIYKYYVACGHDVDSRDVFSMASRKDQGDADVGVKRFYNHSYFQGGAVNHAFRFSFYSFGRVFLCAVY